MENDKQEEVIQEYVEKTEYTQEEVDQIKSEMNDKYLRLFADFENYKRRVVKEKDDLRINTKTMMLFLLF